MYFPTTLAKDASGVRQNGIPGAGLTGGAGAGLGQNAIRYTPFFITNKVVITNWFAFVTTAPLAAGTLYMAIYEADQDLQPVKLVFKDNAPITTSSGVSVGKSGLNIPLSKGNGTGIYLVAVNTDQSGVSVSSFNTPSSIVNNSLGATPLVNRFEVSPYTAADMPDVPVRWTTTINGTEGFRYAVLFKWND